jgi:hypothetical protein
MHRMDSSELKTTIVEEQLICPICLMKFTNPYITIPCGHTFCRTCIDKLHCHSSNCPTCRTTTTGIIKNFAIEGLLGNVQPRKSVHVHGQYPVIEYYQSCDSEQVSKQVHVPVSVASHGNVFERQCPITDACCDFIGVPHGSTRTQTELICIISQYMRYNQVNITQRTLTFKPDAALRILFGTPEKNPDGSDFVIKHPHMERYFNVNVLKPVPVIDHPEKIMNPVVE